MLELVNRNKGIKWDGSSNIYMYKNKEEAKKVLEQIEAEIEDDAQYWSNYKFIKKNEGVLRYLMATK